MCHKWNTKDRSTIKCLKLSSITQDPTLHKHYLGDCSALFATVKTLSMIHIQFVYCIASQPNGGEPCTIPDNCQLPMVCEIILCVIPEQNRYIGGEDSLFSSLRLFPSLQR